MIYSRAIACCWLRSVLLLGICPFWGCSRSADTDERGGRPSGVQVVEKLPPVFLEETPTLAHTFRVSNNTKAPIRFKKLAHTCACSDTTLDKNELQPGEETCLHLNARLNGRFGREAFSVTLMADDGGPEWTYQAEINIYERGHFEPAGIHFGFLKPRIQQERQAVLELYSRAEDVPFALLQIVSSSEHVKVEAGEAATSLASDGIRVQKLPLTIVLIAQSSSGRAAAHITARYERDGTVYESHLPVDWVVRSHFQTTPPRLFFGVLGSTTDDQLQQEVTLRRHDGKPFTVRNQQATRPEVECVVTGPPSSDCQRLLVRFTETPRESVSGEVILETDDPEEEVIRIPFGVFRKPS